MNERFFCDGAGNDRSAVDKVSANGRSAGASSGLAILLVDDNPAVARAMEIAFRIAGHRLDTAANPEEAYSRLARGRYAAILLDMNFSAGRADGEEGLACLTRIIGDDPGACVIVLTAHSGIRIAVAAMQAGARDFVMKPWRNAELIAKVEGATLQGAPAPQPRGYGTEEGGPALLLGDSGAMVRVRELIRRVAPTAAGVTVTGPAGSGRTLAARAIHAASPDAARAAPRIDLRDVDAWTRIGEAEGVVILRHPDRIDPVAQDRLLDRLSPSLRCIAVADSVAGLNPALRRRIATVEVAMPPLALRENDALLLARHFVAAAAERFGRPAARLTPAAEAAVQMTDWPDEVRGLAMAMERAVLLADGDAIDAAALALPMPVPLDAPQAEIRFDLSDAERAMIEAALREHRHNVTQAATALGLSRGALYRRMARYGL